MKDITAQDLKDACDDLATMRYFPSDARASVQMALAQMCPDLEALRWLVNEAVAHVSEWPGLAELRALLCTRYTPDDGIDRPVCTLPGYTPEEQEMKYLARHEELKKLPVTSEESRAVVRLLAPIAAMPSLPPKPPLEIQRRPFQPLSASEIALLESEAANENSSQEARRLAQSLLRRIKPVGATR